MSGMDDLVRWYRAQLDDDERVAREAPAGPWHTSGPHTIAEWTIYDAEWSVASATAYDHNEALGNSRGPGYIDPNATAQHIARWDPDRVLAEVDAKRRILDAHFPVDPCDAHDAMSETIACDTLRLLALPFAGRPGYDESWRP